MAFWDDAFHYGGGALSGGATYPISGVGGAMGAKTDSFGRGMNMAGSGINGLFQQNKDSGLAKMMDPQGFTSRYNPWATDEDKYGVKPGEFDPHGADSDPYNTDPRMKALMDMYMEQLAKYQTPVNMNSDPNAQQAMSMAGAGAMQDAKLRGIQGPYSVGAGEKARYTAGLDYSQKENARRQGLSSTLMGQYGTMLGQQNQLGEQRRQFNTGLNYDRYKAGMDAYNQRVAAHNQLGMGNIPILGNMMSGDSTAKHGGY